MAKTYSKLQSNDTDTKVGFMKSSLQWYEQIRNFVLKVQSSKWPETIMDIDEHLRVSEEMVHLLPVRISQVNANR